MKKSLISALGLAAALALVPVIGATSADAATMHKHHHRHHHTHHHHHHHHHHKKMMKKA